MDLEKFVTRQCICLLAIILVTRIPTYTYTLSFLLLWLLQMWRLNMSQKMQVPIAFHVICGILFPMVECVCIEFSMDTWEYSNPNLLNIPLWLFPLWALIAGCIIDIKYILDFLPKQTIIRNNESML